jgi:hypothetical protein
MSMSKKAQKTLTTPVSSGPKLGDFLVLTTFMHKLLGKNAYHIKSQRYSFKALQEKLNTAKDGFDEEGHSYVSKIISSWDDVDPWLLTKLDEYDARIRGYVERINSHRDTHISLKYFQYLSLLYTEIFLDKYFTDPKLFLRDLDNHAEQLAGKTGNYGFLYGLEDSLHKLAFWMATGSGKTHILHINYLQFMHYNHGPNKIEFDNILLITPSAMLSNQHLRELKMGAIPAELYEKKEGYFAVGSNPDVIQIIPITRLSEKTSTGKLMVDIDSFGTKNLIFVDEGHKGSGGEQWWKFRNQVAKDGFTFEYSATFGQAVASGKKTEMRDLLTDYGKSILFDYSYPYFHRDGYGKDYTVLNVSDTKESAITKHISNPVLMLANLLAFYEQKLLFTTHPELMEEHNISPPLWIFVGSRVKGGEGESDLLQVVCFLHLVLSNPEWTKTTIKSMYAGNSGLYDKVTNKDIFSPSYPELKLPYIRVQTPETTYKGILETVFHTRTSGPLHLFNIKTATGQIGMRCGTGDDIFGVINIGEDTEFIKLVENQEPTITTQDHKFEENLFDTIEDPTSKVNMLVGSRKFMEGWSSWRVSAMGLLNIGKSEGTQIIQLFGRGVRLKGKKVNNNFSLKRTSAFGGVTPDYLEPLETLNIFGIEANYMDKFREYLEEEGIFTDTKISFEIAIEPATDLLKQNLQIPYIDRDNFRREKFFPLYFDSDSTLTVDINLMPRVDVIIDPERPQGVTGQSGPTHQHIDPALLDILNWNRIYHEILKFKQDNRWYNTIFSTTTLRQIIAAESYNLICQPELIRPTSFKKVYHIEEVVITILKKYLSAFYQSEKHTWGMKRLSVKTLDIRHPNMTVTYKISVSDQRPDLVEDIRTLVETKLEEFRKGQYKKHLTNVYFDRHLYQPLLAKYEQDTFIETHPVGLNDGEHKFVERLTAHVKLHEDLFEKKQIILLRNLAKTGVGFYDVINFYPDFILWIIDGTTQHLIFVDPKGLGLGIHTLKDKKIQLCKKIKEHEETLKIKYRGIKISLDSAIVTTTKRATVYRNFQCALPEKYDKYHVYFHEDPHYMEKLLGLVM